ncbi:MAG: peptidase S8 [Bacteroidetes bacterium]|nr:MAG: peptidase S8 [Bacteroidota bacterium]
MDSVFRDCNFRVVIKYDQGNRSSHPSIRGKIAQSAQRDCERFEQLRKMIPGHKIKKLFTTLDPERVFERTRRGLELDCSYLPPEFANYYCVDCRRDIEAKKIVTLLKRKRAVELAYVEVYSTSPPTVKQKPNPLSDFQDYLTPAPTGVDARYAWKFPGGDGTGKVKFIDIEQGWLFNHEDLTVRQLSTTGLSHFEYEDHGAAVLGVIMMKDNSVGGIGITPNVKGYVMSQWRPDGVFNTADAILAAIDHLKFGDILLLEAQAFDVHTKNSWPVEIHEANFQAIRLATALGIVVIEAAGNGIHITGNNLDDFPDEGRTIFNRSRPHFRDSGAIMVAAAWGKVSRSRMNCSNYGTRIDCFASGEDVVTAGLFPRSSRGARDTYSTSFCGTSSAAAIITGVAIAVQSIIERKYSSRIGPKEMRRILSNKLYGTTLGEGHQADKIGVMPDLKKIIDRALNLVRPVGKEIRHKQSKKLSQNQGKKRLQSF